MPGLRDRVLSRAGAEAITAPGAIVAGGVGASVAILAGAPIAVIGAVGAAAYAGIVALRLPRTPQRPKVDPDRLGEPWRGFVREAIDARDRFDRAVTRTRQGPLRERLGTVGDRIDTGVQESFRIAQHGEALEDALRELEPMVAVRRRLEDVEEDLAGERAGDDQLVQLASSLRAQLASTERIAKVARDTRDRLRLLDARLDESVARVVELSLSSGDTSSVGALDSDVDAIVTELESLRLALEETRTA